jgi:hypothetical protein
MTSVLTQRQSTNLFLVASSRVGLGVEQWGLFARIRSIFTWYHVCSHEEYGTEPGVSILFLNFVAEAPRIDNCRVGDFINIRLQGAKSASVTSDGMLLYSYLWSVNKGIDFTLIKAKRGDIWERLICWRMILDAKKSDIPEQFCAREIALTKRLSQPGVTDEALREFNILVMCHMIRWCAEESTVQEYR